MIDQRIENMLKRIDIHKSDTELLEYVKSNPTNSYMVNMLMEEYDRKLSHAYYVIDHLISQNQQKIVNRGAF